MSRRIVRVRDLRQPEAEREDDSEFGVDGGLEAPYEMDGHDEESHLSRNVETNDCFPLSEQGTAFCIACGAELDPRLAQITAKCTQKHRGETQSKRDA